VKFLSFNLLLAIFWMFLTGAFGMGSFLVGFVVGLLILFMLRPVVQSEPYLRAVAGSVRLLGVYVYKLVAANLQLARDILRPTPQIKGGFFRFDARALQPPETALLANMVSLTPGTLTVDSDDQGHWLYIHTVYAQDPEKIRRGVQLFADLIHNVVGMPLAQASGAAPPEEKTP
jgi:multicomponent Na+:H+ antiporter subunit E